jgi:raffinose/stachyose/melibiose transport system permease protein
LAAYLYLAPALVLYTAFALVPFGWAVWISFFEWDGVTAGSWVGFDNYVAVVTNARLRGSFTNALVLIVFYSIIPVSLALVLAGTMSRAKVRGLTLLRGMLFLPQILAMVVIGTIWRWIYGSTGPFNRMLEVIGLGELTRPWLGDFTFALPALGIVGTWFMLGLALVLLTAAAQRVPLELYEAASVDGAGPIRQFFSITVPSVRNEIAVALVLTMLGALRNFDLVYVTTMGGPGYSTAVPAFEVYNQAFRLGRVGAASAVGVVLALLIFSISFVITRVAERGDA